MSKPRVIKDYNRLEDAVITAIKLTYPYGFEAKLIQFKNKEGKLISALPFETEDYYYLLRMTQDEARNIMEEDDDFDEDGNLTEEAIERLEDELDDTK